MSKRRHNFGTKRFKEKSLFIFHARIALKSLILLFVRLIARGARIGKTHTHTHTHTHTQTDKTSTVTLAHARRGLMNNNRPPAPKFRKWLMRNNKSSLSGLIAILTLIRKISHRTDLVVFKMRDSVPSARYSSVCNVLRLWSI